MKTKWVATALFALVATVGSGLGGAAELPAPSDHDARVRYIDYVADQVTVVTVRRGAVTRIVLGENEHILVAASGFGADCTKLESEWCVRADVGTNQVWIKPKVNATENNLELKTDKHDYSFEFRVLPDTRRGGGAEPMFRVIFRYPEDVVRANAALAISMAVPDPAVEFAAKEKQLLDDRLLADRPVPRNWKYSMQVLPGSADIAPSLVFDDGHFTYLRFSGNREIPTIFYISPAAEEGRVNFHMDGDLAVVQRMGKQFVLRLGAQTVGIWNDAFDAEGVPPKEGTLVEGVTRTISSGR